MTGSELAQRADRDAGLSASLIGLPGASSAIEGAKPARNAALIAAGFDVRLTPSVTLGARFDGGDLGWNQPLRRNCSVQGQLLRKGTHPFRDPNRSDEMSGFAMAKPGSFSIDLIRVNGHNEARRNPAEAQTIAEEAIHFMRRYAEEDAETKARQRGVGDQRQVLTRAVVHDGQDPEAAAVRELVGDEVE